MSHLRILLVLVFLSSCAVTPHMPGIVVVSKGNVTTTLVKKPAKKTGEACTISILGLVTVGNASIDSAIKNGQIKKVSYIDNSYKNILGIYQQYCTLARGI